MRLMLQVCFFFSLVPVSAALAANSCQQDGRGYVSSASCGNQGMSYTICYVSDGHSRGRLNPGETQEFDAPKVILGITFNDGIEVAKEEAQTAA
jgi:hypothetical protein